MGCILCGGTGVGPFFADRRRTFVHCPQCDLVFVPRAQLLGPTEERARYAQHHNTAADPAYLRYIDGCIAELRRLPLEGARILDFGCGEHAVMAARLRSLGLECTAYDPLYGLGAHALAGTYDVVAAVEVMEHLREPRQEIERLVACLGLHGRLFVRTLLRSEDAPFCTWWYKNDPTHVNFFSEETWRHVARRFALRWDFCDGRQITVLRAQEARVP